MDSTLSEYRRFLQNGSIFSKMVIKLGKIRANLIFILPSNRK